MKVGAGGEMEEKWIIYLHDLRQLFVVHRFIWQFPAALEKTPLPLPGSLFLFCDVCFRSSDELVEKSRNEIDLLESLSDEFGK